MTDVTIFGAGAFGTALAISLAKDGREALLVSRDRGATENMATARVNTGRLPGFPFPDKLNVSANPSDASGICLIAIPTQKLAGFLQENRDSLDGKTIVACCKGIDLASGKGPSELINRIITECQTAVLSGPSFAVDIAGGLPTALTLACDNQELGRMLQQQLSTSNLRLYRSIDVPGVELGGALKNVVAIASGIAIGAHLGESARAALVTRGYAEMVRFAMSYGAKAETLAGLAGFGDLILTATSEKSRNYTYGLTIGRGQKPDPSVTVEGIATANAVKTIASSRRLEMPITSTVSALTNGKITVQEAIEALLARPLKEE